MVGLFSTIPHIVTIILLWLVAMVILWGFKRFMVKYAEIDFEYNLDKVVRATRYLITSAAFVSIILVVFFLSNPFERAEIKTIPKAEVEESFTPPSLDSINNTNKQAVSEKSNENWKEAEEDSYKAMEKADDIFKDPYDK